MKFAALLVLVPLTFGCASAPDNPVSPDSMLDASASAVQSLKADNESLDYFLQRSRGVLIFPSLSRGGVIVGFIGGAGVLVERNGESWGQPSFFNITGVNVGAQVGAETGRVVVVIMNSRLIDVLHTGALDFGLAAGIAVGPGSLKAASSLQTMQDAYVFRDLKGAYAGLTLDGAVATKDDARNATYRAGGATGGSLAALRGQLAPAKP